MDRLAPLPKGQLRSFAAVSSAPLPQALIAAVGFTGVSGRVSGEMFRWRSFEGEVSKEKFRGLGFDGEVTRAAFR